MTTTLPNWVDLVIIVLIARAAYVGFGRGGMAEVFHLLGSVVVTASACSLYGPMAHQITALGWSAGDPSGLQLVCFLLIFVVSWLLVHKLLQRILPMILREPGHHVIMQTVGLAAGTARGMWWAGVTLLFLLALGIPYLTASVQERSLLGPWTVDLGGRAIRAVADRLPHDRRHALIPQVTVRLPRLPFDEPAGSSAAR